MDASRNTEDGNHEERFIGDRSGRFRVALNFGDDTLP
jgi:hypothetical protein